ncbi:MAG: hypothetical protein L3K03_02815 [Thermoplasmata archaeon]|nr:hypothetical protein [Thermoplasmata archaeon]
MQPAFAPDRPNLPGTVDRFPPGEERLLAYASAIGAQFDFELLVEAMGGPAEPVAEEAERLVLRGILWESPGGGQFAFSDEEQRARSYNAMTESRRRVVHHRVAVAMERQNPQPTPEVLAELGRHYFMAKIGDKSYAFNRQAAENARRDQRLDLAALRLERAREELARRPDPDLIEIEQLDEDIGILYQLLGFADMADRAFQDALAHLPAENMTDRARLHFTRAEMALDSANFRQALDSIERAHALFDALRDLHGQARSHRLRARIERYRDPAEALDEAMHSFERFLETHEERARGQGALEIAVALELYGRPIQTETEHWFRRAIAILEPTGGLWESAQAYRGIARLRGAADPAGAHEALERSLVLCESAHDDRGLAWTHLGIADLKLTTGEVDGADAALDEAIRTFDRIGSRIGQQAVLRRRGVVYERRGLWAEASRALTEAAEMARAIDIPIEVVTCEYHLAHLAFRTGDLPRARAQLDTIRSTGLPEKFPLLADELHRLAEQMQLPAGAAA